MPITLENIEEVFTFHKWSPEQVEKGNAIRAAAKELVRARLEISQRANELAKAIADSGPCEFDFLSEKRETALQEYAIDRRAHALEVLDDLPFTQRSEQEHASAVNEIVMIANSAITFEAANLEPIEPADVHSERVAS